MRYVIAVVSKVLPYLLSIVLGCFLFVSLTYGGAFNNKYSLGASGFKESDYIVLMFDEDKVASYWVVKNGKISRNTEGTETQWETAGNVYSTKGTVLVIDIIDKKVDYEKMSEKYDLSDKAIKDIRNALGY